MKYNRCLVLAIFASFVLLGCNQNEPTEKKEAAKSTAIRVTTAKPKIQTLTRTTTQPARVEAYEQTSLFARIDGYVRDVKVDIDDEVAKDQPLAILSVPELTEDLHQKEALVEQAKAQVSQAEHNVVVKEKAAISARARISETAAAVDRAEGESNRWQAEHERIKLLAKSGSISQKLVDETENQFRSAAAAQKEAAAKVSSAEASLGESEAEVQKAKADLAAAAARQKVAEAELERARVMLQYTTIRAPYAGVITQRMVQTGDLVQPGARGTPLLVIANTERVRIVVDVPEFEASLVGIGDPVSIVVSAYSIVPIRVKGENGLEQPKVTRTSWSLQSAARTLQTEIHLDNPERRLRPGMYGTVTITSEVRPNVLSIPITAVVTRKGETCCCCADNGQANFKPVTLGLRAGGDVEIVSGITRDDDVIVVNAAQIEQGQTVTLAAKE